MKHSDCKPCPEDARKKLTGYRTPDQAAWGSLTSGFDGCEATKVPISDHKDVRAAIGQKQICESGNDKDTSHRTPEGLNRSALLAVIGGMSSLIGDSLQRRTFASEKWVS